MSKRRTNPGSRQAADLEAHRRVSVQLPLALLATWADAKNAFVELCLETGRQTLGQMMEHDRTALCGPKGQHQRERRAYRSGSVASEVTFGGRRIPLRRPRVRTVSGEELSLPSFEVVASRDPLDEQTLALMAAGVTTRRYADTLEPLPETEPERSVSKSSVSRRFVALTQAQLTRWLSQPIDELDIRIVLIDGKVFADHTVLIALGIAANGRKYVLGLREGTTENAAVCRGLLSDLIERGLPADRRTLFVIDGGKGIRAGIRECFGSHAIVQRCLAHKERNVIEHLPPELHASVRSALHRAWYGRRVDLARRQLKRLARSLDATHPGAAGSILEGLEEQLTVVRLGLEGELARGLRTTNAIENLMGAIARYTHNVKRWRDGRMIVRWAAAAVLDAQSKFHRIRGYRDLPKLFTALQAMDCEQVAA